MAATMAALDSASASFSAESESTCSVSSAMRASASSCLRACSSCSSFSCSSRPRPDWIAATACSILARSRVNLSRASASSASFCLSALSCSCRACKSLARATSSARVSSLTSPRTLAVASAASACRACASATLAVRSWPRPSISRTSRSMRSFCCAHSVLSCSICAALESICCCNAVSLRPLLVLLSARIWSTRSSFFSAKVSALTLSAVCRSLSSRALVSSATCLVSASMRAFCRSSLSLSVFTSALSFSDSTFSSKFIVETASLGFFCSSSCSRFCSAADSSVLRRSSVSSR